MTGEGTLPWPPSKSKPRVLKQATQLPRTPGPLAGHSLPPVEYPDFDLRNGQRSPATVSLAPGALAGIIADLDTTPEGFETGGMLIGRHQGSTVHVAKAWGPAPTAIRRHDSMAPDWGSDLERAKQGHAANPSCAPVGFWHLHPIGEAAPSLNDLLVFGALFVQCDQIARLPYLVALIATPSERGQAPDLTAWVVRHRDDGSGLVCEPADIETTPRGNGSTQTRGCGFSNPALADVTGTRWRREAFFQ